MNHHEYTAVAITSHKERGYYYAVAMELINGSIEYSEADVWEQGLTRNEAIRKARHQLNKKGYQVVAKWEL